MTDDSVPATPSDSAAQAGSPAPLPTTPSFLQECRATLRLALPLIGGQLGQMVMGLIDTAMLGHLGDVVPMDASAFATSLVSVPFVFGIGLLTAISVRVANARGAGRHEDAHNALRHGTWFAIGYGVLVTVAIAALVPFLHIFRQSPEVTRQTPAFLLMFAASVIPAFFSLAWKNHADALHNPWPSVWIYVCGIGLNVLVNWLWIFGHWGFPAMGLIGSGLATLVVRTAMAVAIFIWFQKSQKMRAWLPHGGWFKVSWAGIRNLLAIGGPASLGLLTEVSAFAAATLVIGGLRDVVALAAHQVAFNCAATAFMIPLGVGMALTVRMGAIAGAKQRERMHRVLCSGWVIGAAFTLISMIAFLSSGRWFVHRFITEDEPRYNDIVAVATQLLVVAGFFQIFDGQQAICAGALRGTGDVRMPALLALLAYWGLAVPLGAALTLYFHCGPVGMWIGLAAGLGASAIVLSIRAWMLLGPKASGLGTAGET